jgi:hypothetical protein
MNIFYLDKDPKQSVKYYVDRHITKMQLETAQILCSNIRYYGKEAPYKKTHVNHPSTIWARQSKSNFKYLIRLGLEICKEYTYRYGKIHKSQSVIEWVENNIPEELPDLPFTEPTPAMPEKYIINNDSVASYRNYYLHEKTHLFSWNNRKIPFWVKNNG